MLEQRLYQAIVLQAFKDLRSMSPKAEERHAKQSAINWLLGGSKDLHHICYLAGYAPEYIAYKAKIQLLKRTEWRALPGTGKRFLQRKLKMEKQNAK